MTTESYASKKSLSQKASSGLDDTLCNRLSFDFLTEQIKIVHFKGHITNDHFLETIAFLTISTGMISTANNMETSNAFAFKVVVLNT